MELKTNTDTKCNNLSQIKKDRLELVVYEQVLTQENKGILKKSRITGAPVPDEYTRIKKINAIPHLSVGLEWEDVKRDYQFSEASLWEKAKLILGFEERDKAGHTYAAREDKNGIVRHHEKNPDQKYVRVLQKKDETWRTLVFDKNGRDITDIFDKIKEEYLPAKTPQDNPLPFNVFTLKLEGIKYVETSTGKIVVNEISKNLQKQLLKIN